jgi:hypothetical protein
MEGLIQDIYEIYSEEVDMLTGFIRVSMEKKEIIKKMELLQLDRIIRTEEALLMKFTFLQSRRRKAMDMFKNEQGIKGEITLKNMDQYLTVDEKDQFAMVKKQYELAIIQQQQLNNFNQNILKQQTDYVQVIRNQVDKKQETSESEVVIQRPIVDRKG